MKKQQNTVTGVSCYKNKNVFDENLHIPDYSQSPCSQQVDVVQHETEGEGAQRLLRVCIPLRHRCPYSGNVTRFI